MLPFLGPRLLGLFNRPREVDALDPLIDDSRRRLCRAGEQPRRLDPHGDVGLHERDPPPFVERRRR